MNKDRIFTLVITIFLLIGFVVSLYTVNRIDLISDRLDRANTEYQMVVEDDSVIIFDRERYIGKVRLQGQLDSLIIIDNQ